MEERRLGRQGPLVSVLGLGCNNFGSRLDAREAEAVVAAALDAGITLFDTADVYGETVSEELLGRALGKARPDVVIATKFGVRLEGGPAQPTGSREYVRWAVERSLGRLGTDLIDLYQYHWPDQVTPVEETVGCLAELRSEGKIGAFGVSNFDVDELTRAQRRARADGAEVAAAQNRLSLLRLHQEEELLAACQELGCGLLAYLPLESGLLTGRFRRGAEPPPGSRFVDRPDIWGPDDWLTDAMFTKVERLEQYALGRGASPLEASLGWLAAVPGVASVLVGASKPDQVHADAAAVRVRPEAADLVDLNDILEDGDGDD